MATKSVITATTQDLSWKTFKHQALLKHVGLGGESFVQIIFFLGEVAALELVQRVSRARCPYVWHTLQALQIFCFPPFKWIKRWSPFKVLVKCMQKISRPLLLVSVITTFYDQSVHSKRFANGTSDPHSSPELHDQQPVTDPSASLNSVENASHEDWLMRLKKELENQGINLPDRLTDVDLHRFYMAANGDFSCFLSSVKRTIRWRETYYILSYEELKMWSHLVYWHGIDVKLRPCLIIRLGLACCTLDSHDRPRFAQAIVSQIEYGVLNLVNAEDPRVTVLMDCEGVSTLGFPVQMLRSFSLLLQDHYPNCLALMLVLRLPLVAQVIAETVFQVLKPATQEKLRVVGEGLLQILAENIQTIPCFLGGECTCSKCLMHNVESPRLWIRGSTERDLHSRVGDEEGEEGLSSISLPQNVSCAQTLRTAIICILMLWILIALGVCLYEFDSFSLIVP